MPTETERTSISFTGEAELALRRTLGRFERQLRAKAADEAVRSRGVPAEVTGSDINKAFLEIVAIHRVPPHLLNRVRRGELPFEVAEEFLEREKTREKRPQRPKHFIEKLSSLYIWAGVFIAIFGLLYAPIYKTFLGLIADPAWKTGLLIFATGTAVAVVGFVSRFVFRRRPGTR